MCGAIIKLQVLLMLFHWPHAARLSLLFTAFDQCGLLPRKVIFVTFHVWVLYLNPNPCLLDLFAITVCTPPCKRQVIITCAALSCVLLLLSSVFLCYSRITLLHHSRYFCCCSIRISVFLHLGVFVTAFPGHVSTSLYCVHLSCSVLCISLLHCPLCPVL